MPEGGGDRGFSPPWQAFQMSAAGQQPLQIFAVFAVLYGLDQAAEAGIVDIALAPGDLLGAADLQALAVLDRLDELRGAQEVRGRAGVEPGIAAPQSLDVQPALPEIVRVDVGDLEFAARRTRDLGRELADVGIVEVETRDGPVRARLLRLLDDPDRPIIGVELDHAI